MLAFEINLIPDWTTFVQLAIFLSTLVVLNFFVFRPTLRTLDRRREFTEERRVEAEKLGAEAEFLEKEMASKLSAEIESLTKENNIRIAAANRDAEKTVRAARLKAKEISDSADHSIAVSEERLALEMKKSAAELAGDIVRRITD